MRLASAESEVHICAPDMTGPWDKKLGNPSTYDDHIVSILAQRT
jgi:hypothetical protein